MSETIDETLEEKDLPEGKEIPVDNNEAVDAERAVDAAIEETKTVINEKINGMIEDDADVGTLAVMAS